jgi:hypothetical protein
MVLDIRQSFLRARVRTYFSIHSRQLAMLLKVADSR